jgi:hypothetical protein
MGRLAGGDSNGGAGTDQVSVVRQAFNQPCRGSTSYWERSSNLAISRVVLGDNRAAIELLLGCLEVFGTCDWDSQSQSNNFDKLFDPQRWELFLRYPNVKAVRAEHSLSA